MNKRTICQVLQEAQNLLCDKSDSVVLDVEILLAFALQQERSFLHARPEQVLTEEQIQTFFSYVFRRQNREPIAYILSQREFWSLPLSVNPATLIPRPETELLVEWLLERFDNQVLKVCDLGTGSGAIALALAKERPAWQIYAVDNSENALQIARKNAHTLQLSNVSFYCSYWLTELSQERFDVIVTNPPYLSEAEWVARRTALSFEPKTALVAGKTGLEAISEISKMAQNALHSKGYLLVEHGFFQQVEVCDMLTRDGYLNIQALSDLSGVPRVVVGQQK